MSSEARKERILCFNRNVDEVSLSINPERLWVLFELTRNIKLLKPSSADPLQIRSMSLWWVLDQRDDHSTRIKANRVSKDQGEVLRVLLEQGDKGFLRLPELFPYREGKST